MDEFTSTFIYDQLIKREKHFLHADKLVLTIQCNTFRKVTLNDGIIKLITIQLQPNLLKT